MSLSAAGTNWSANSTTEIFEPNELYTVPISKPIMPPPSTNIFSGISLSSNAPVESIIRGSSVGMNGKLTTDEPAAIIAFSKVMVVVPFSPSTASVLLPVNLP